MSEIDSAISSPHFWAMTHCISHVCYEAEFVGRFAEGCWCHEDVFEEYQVARVARLCNVRCVCVCQSCFALHSTAQHCIFWNKCGKCVQRVPLLLMFERGSWSFLKTDSTSTKDFNFLRMQSMQ